MAPPANAAAEAGRVLTEIWLGRPLPVDPVQIALAMGIEVRQAMLSENISGALVKGPGQAPIIILSQLDHPTRQRFTCAHELGHYVRRAGEDEFATVDLRNQRSKEGTDPEEVFANAFAANLLLPEDQVRKEAKAAPPLWLLARRFGVSPEAMSIRLEKLGISYERHRRLNPA